MTESESTSEALIAPWRNSIEWARTEPELLAVVNSFLSEWSAKRLSTLPAHLRPTKVEGNEEIVRWALLFAAAEPRLDRSRDVSLRQMTLFFKEVYKRLPEIYRETLEAPAI